MRIKIFTTGGSIDKHYSTRESAFVVGRPTVESIVQDANVTVDCEIASLMRKDSLEMSNADRRKIVESVKADQHRRIVITHGTDTMIETARALCSLKDKVIVLTGAMQPTAFKDSDAPFNVGAAFAAVQILPPGVYIAMNGRIFDPGATKKNVARDRFEPRAGRLVGG